MVKLINGDCLEEMFKFDKHYFDMIMVDPPYGTTKCAWDSKINLYEMWFRINHVLKPDGAAVFTSDQPFTSYLICSNIENYKYGWIWEKPSAKGHLNAKIRPMKAHEDICVFYKKQPTYNPQKTMGHCRKVSRRVKELNSDVYNKNTKDTYYDSTERYPRSVQKISQDTQKSSLHPTQKPVKLMEYLIKTYTNEGDNVLDFCMGSGTTGVACSNINRNFVGIELNNEYFDIASERLK